MGASTGKTRAATAGSGAGSAGGGHLPPGQLYQWVSITAVTGSPKGMKVLNSHLELHAPADLGFCSSVQTGKTPLHIPSSLSLETQRHKGLRGPAGARAGLRRKGQSSRDMDRLLGDKAEQAGVAPGRDMAWGGWRCWAGGGWGCRKGGWTRTEGMLDEETEWKW